MSLGGRVAGLVSTWGHPESSCFGWQLPVKLFDKNLIYLVQDNMILKIVFWIKAFDTNEVIYL